MAAGTRRGRRSPHARASQETPPTSSENTTGHDKHTSQKRFIVVDGANVAFESPSNGGKPRLCNILSVCRVLEERGFLPRAEVRRVAEAAIARQQRGAEREKQVRTGAKLGELSGATAKVLARLRSE